MLSGLTTKYVRLRRPLVAGILAPSTADKVVREGIMSYLEVIPAKKALASTYFPFGYQMKGDVAIAPMLFPGKSAEVLGTLRARGNVLVISEPIMKDGVYVFSGIMLAFETQFIGNMAWHVAKAGYPPLSEGREPLYRSPPLLATLESVVSGEGLYVHSSEVVPISVDSLAPVPLALLGLASWRRGRLAARKEGEEGREDPGEG
ncbi:MAG: hypothetical protein GXO07_05030 [Crenarchaeota archaeon]|nr:hypothetical protein [Thermoproteota archaeon]